MIGTLTEWLTDYLYYFIKTTDHRPTDPPTTYPPTHEQVVINLH